MEAKSSEKPTKYPRLVREQQAVIEPADATEEKVAEFLSRVIPATAVCEYDPARALVPWVCDVLQSEHSVKAYGTDLAHFAGHMKQLGIEVVQATADHVKIYKAALLKARIRPATVARRLSVIRGSYRQFAEKGIVDWQRALDIQAVKAPPVKKNTTPALTHKQAIAFLESIPTDSLQGIRDFAMFQTFFITGCRVSAILNARVGDIEFDGVEHYLHVTEKRNKESRKILLDAARPVLQYVEAAGIVEDRDGPLFRPFGPDRQRLQRQKMDRKTPWRLVKKYCGAAGIDSDRLTGRGIGIHSLRKTAINDAIRNGSHMHEVREFAGHSDIRTTELYYVRREEDAEAAARRIQIRMQH